MKTRNENHLTNEQFTELLIGGAPGPECGPECELHLAQCELCRNELTKFSESVALFTHTSLAWSDAQPGRSLRTRAARRTSRLLYAPMGWALAAALLVLIAVPPAWKYEHRSVGDHASAAGRVPALESAQQDSAAQIAQDNQLLESVNVALNTNDASPLPEYRLSDSPRLGARTDSRIP